MAEPIKAFDTLGNKVTIPAEQIANAQRLGYRVATPEELAAEAVRKEYGGTLEQIGAGATGVASGLTLGLSDIALSELGGRERLAAYETLYPTERMAGTVAGAVLPALLTAGTSTPATGASLAAQGARAALAASPAALATRAGAVATSALGLAAVEGAAQGAARTALRYGVAAGVESAIQGVGAEAGRLAIDDRLTGESLGQLATAGLVSAGVGATLGGGLGLLGGGARSVLSRRQVALAGEAPEGIRPSAWARLQTRAQEISARVRGADPAGAAAYAERTAAREMGMDAADELAARLGQPSPLRAAVGDVPVPPASVVAEASEAATTAQASSAVADAEQMGARMDAAGDAVDDVANAAAAELSRLDARGAAGRKIRDELDDFLIGEEFVEAITRSSAVKADVLIADNVAPELLAQQKLFAENMLLQFDDTIRQIADDPLGYSQQPLKRLRAVAARVERGYYAALELPSGEQSRELYRLLDRELKSDMGAITAGLKRGAATPEARGTASALTDFYKLPQAGLEDANLWGEIGNVQRQVNEQLSEAITRKKAFAGDWYESVDRRKNPADPWKSLPLSDPRKIESIIRDAVSPMGSTAERTLVERLGNLKALTDIYVANGTFAARPKLLTAVQSQGKRIERILAKFDELKSLQREIDFENPAGTGFSRMVDAVPGASTLRGVANAVLSPRIIAGAFRTVESLAGTQSAAIDSSVARAMRAVGSSVVAVAERAPAIGAAGARYQERSTRVRDLTASRPAVIAALERETAWMADAAPIARNEAVGTASRKLDYLQRHLPTGLAAATPFAAPLPPTKQQQNQWLSRVKALDNPAGILDDLTAGKLTAEAVDAVREVYPETYGRIVARVTERLTALQARGKAPPYLQRIQLGLLLGIPTDPTLAPELAGAIQASYAAQPGAVRTGGAMAAPARSGKPPQIAAGYRSGSEETALTSDQP